MDIWEDKLTDILVEKEKTHGKFATTAMVAQSLKDMLRNGGTSWNDGDRLTFEQQEALECICTKMARIVSGDANEPDHWLDIAGYAALGRRSVSSEH
jgi:hypothetical protein